MKTLYERSECFDDGYLKVSDLHSLYYAQYGKKDGVPVVFLHGGPGGGTSPIVSQYFDPEYYRIILFDQRGAAKSKPHGEMRENTSQDLVEDIERLREHLGIAKWHVFGGSWGSTLSLLYAIAHPDKVLSMVLRGIFLATQKEIDWIYYEGGASRFYPQEFERYKNFIPEEERGDMIQAYGKRLFGDDKELMLKAAHEWCMWECAIIKVFPEVYSMTDDEAISMGRAECHYFMNKFFLDDENYIMNNIDKIKDIPCTIVQGRFDMDCPPFSAYDLHKALPKSKLNLVQLGAHASLEFGLIDGLVDAMDEHRKL